MQNAECKMQNCDKSSGQFHIHPRSGYRHSAFLILQSAFPKDAVFVDSRNSHVAYFIVESLAFGVDLHIIGRVAGIKCAVHLFKQHRVGGTNQLLPEIPAHL